MHICPRCGTSFQRARYSHRVYCSITCAAKAREARRHAHQRARSCERCDAPRARGALCNRHRLRRRMGIPDCDVRGCQKTGRREDRLCVLHRPQPAPPSRSCRVCGQAIAARRQYCAACLPPTYGYTPRPATPRPCAGCGIEIVKRCGRRDRSFCEPCRIIQYRAVHDAAKARRRAQMTDTRSEPVQRMRVFDRDQWCCRLCGDPVDRSARVPNHHAPTLDHIVPLSAGGAHTYANIQTAHFICNSLRGARPIAA